MNQHKQPKSAISVTRSIFKNKIFLFIALCLLAIIAGIYFVRPVTNMAPTTTVEKPSAPVSVKTPEPAHFVGAESCQQCHQKEFEAWRGSHHALAMQEANAQTVLGDFDNAKFTHNGIESTFFKQDGLFMVRTDGEDGQLKDYPIAYTFGVTPLQQYLIKFPNGRSVSRGIVVRKLKADNAGFICILKKNLPIMILCTGRDVIRIGICSVPNAIRRI
jgi:hypothetical protein